jgi:hypothetical protein
LCLVPFRGFRSIHSVSVSVCVGVRIRLRAQAPAGRTLRSLPPAWVPSPAVPSFFRETSLDFDSCIRSNPSSEVQLHSRHASCAPLPCLPSHWRLCALAPLPPRTTCSPPLQAFHSLVILYDKSCTSTVDFLQLNSNFSITSPCSQTRRLCMTKGGNTEEGKPPSNWVLVRASACPAPSEEVSSRRRAAAGHVMLGRNRPREE